MLFPLKKHEKTPAYEGWRTENYDPFDVELHVDGGGNVGLRLDKSILIVDVDTKNLPESVDMSAAEFLDDFLFEYGLMGRVRIHRTVSGGFHIFLRKDPSVEINTYPFKNDPKIGKALEFKTEGTFIVMPPSYVVDFDKGLDGPYTVYEAGPGEDRDSWPMADSVLMDRIKKVHREKDGTIDELPFEFIEKLVGLLPLDQFGPGSYSEWLKIGQAIHAGTDGSQAGEDLFASWSAANPAFGPGEDKYARDKWKTFNAGGEINVHYIKKVLKDFGIRVPREKTAAKDFADVVIEDEPIIVKPQDRAEVRNFVLEADEDVEERRRQMLLKCFEALVPFVEDGVFERPELMKDHKGDWKKAAVQSPNCMIAILNSVGETRVEDKEVKKDLKKAVTKVKRKLDKFEDPEPRLLIATPADIYSGIDEVMKNRPWGVDDSGALRIRLDNQEIVSHSTENWRGAIETHAKYPAVVAFRSSATGGAHLWGVKALAKDMLESSIVRREFRATPSWPLRDQVIYGGDAIRWQAPGDGSALEEFLRFFNPSEEKLGLNKKAMLMLLLTMCHDSNKKKPVFAICSSGKSENERKNTGKTAFLSACSRLMFGWEPAKIDPASTYTAGKEQIGAALAANPEQRLFVVENATMQTFTEKSKISQTQMIAMSEDPFLTVRLLGGNERQVFNNKVFAVTTNDPIFTNDMADRVMVIRLDPPKVRDPYWDSKLERFIRDRRLEVLRDIWAIISRSAANATQSLTRLVDWNNEIVMRVVTAEEWAEKGAAWRDQVKMEQASVQREGSIFRELHEFMFQRLHQIHKLPEGHVDEYSHIVVPKTVMGAILSDFVRIKRIEGVRSEMLLTEMKSHIHGLFQGDARNDKADIKIREGWWIPTGANNGKAWGVKTVTFGGIHQGAEVPILKVAK